MQTIVIQKKVVYDKDASRDYNNTRDRREKEVSVCGVCDSPTKLKLGDHYYKCSDCTKMDICTDWHHLYEEHDDRIHAYH